MINLSCSYKSKNVEVKITENLDLIINDEVNPYVRNNKLSAKDANAVVEVLKSKFIEYQNKDVLKQSFQEVTKDFELIEKARQVIKDIRTANTYDTRSSSKLKDELDSFINRIFYYEKESENKFSMAEQLVINKVTDGRRFYSIDSSDFEVLYNPITRSRDSLIKLSDELMAFPFKNYHEDISGRVRSALEVATERINAFEVVADQAGSDIVNWTQHKFTRRLSDAGLKVNYYQISQWTSDLIKHFLAKGIEVESKTRKPSLMEKRVAKWEAGQVLTQEEIIAIFKQTNHIEAMVELMNYESLIEIMGSDLKIVKGKICGWRNHLETIGLRIADKAMSLAPVNIDEFNRITSFLSKHISAPNWEFMLKFSEISPQSYVIKWAENYIGSDITLEYYDKFFASLTNKELVNINYAVTKEFVSRLSEQEKISLLPRLGQKFIKSAENSIHWVLSDDEWFDELKSAVFDSKDFCKLYKDVAWEPIREVAVKLFKQNTIDLVLANKDRESAIIILKDNNYLNEDHIMSLLSILSKQEKIKVMTEDTQFGSGRYHKAITTMLNSFEDLVELHNESIDFKYLDLILQIATKSNYDMQAFRNVILARSPQKFPLTPMSLAFLDVKTKKHLLTTGCDLGLKSNTSSFAERSTGLIPSLMTFFADLKREDIEASILGNYLIYLAHVMTPEERVNACDMSSQFLRANIDYMPYSYLKKYEGKEAFKKLVGDQRNPYNARFASVLERKLNKQT